MWAQIINTLVGIWLMISPGMLGYQDLGTDSNHIIGPVISTIAMVSCWEVTRELRKFNIPLGLWLVAAPWVLGYENILPTINDTLSGVLVLSLAMIRGKIKGKYGGGWKSLWQSRRNS